MRTMIICGLVAVMGVTGCALTPAEFRSTGQRDQFQLTLPPTAAAACVARNIENAADGIWMGNAAVGIKNGVTPGTTELTVPAALVAEFSPNEHGTSAVVWTSQYILSFIREKHLAAFKGC